MLSTASCNVFYYQFPQAYNSVKLSPSEIKSNRKNTIGHLFRMSKKRKNIYNL